MTATPIVGDEFEAYKAAVAEEYGTYRATTKIEFGGALAYVPGDSVPVSNVERYRYLDQGLVERVPAPDPEPAGDSKAPAKKAAAK